jgi:flagellar biogenesis protein FliO
MNQETNQTTTGSQTAKEREAIRQLFKGGLFFVIALIILIAVILYLLLS